MQLFSSLTELIAAVNLDRLARLNERDNNASWVYVQLEIWRRDPRQAQLLVLNDDDEERGYDPLNEDCPAQAMALKMQPFIEYATLEDVLSVQYDYDSSCGTGCYIDALNHYREHDSFMTGREESPKHA